MTDQSNLAPVPESTIETFLEQLGSESPSPGGGAAGAVAGAIGTRLLEMTCRYSSGENDEEAFTNFIERLVPISDRLSELAEQDQRTYEAYRARVDEFGSDDDRAIDLLARSTRIPIDMGNCCREVLDGFLDHRDRMKSEFESDVRTAVRLIRVAWCTSEDLASWNLEQLPRIPDRTELREELHQLQQEMNNLFDQLGNEEGIRS